MTSDPPDLNRLAELDADIAAGIAADPRPGTAPAARAVLDALAATRAELAALPELPVPPELTARWTAALPPPRVDDMDTPCSPIRHSEPSPRPTQLFPRTDHAEDRQIGAAAATYDRECTEPAITPQPAAGTRAGAGAGPGPARPAGRGGSRHGSAAGGGSRRRPAGRGRSRRVRPAVAVGLALAGLLVVAGVLQSRPTDTAVDLGSLARAAVGTHDAGELADPVRRAGCLRSVAPPGLDPDAVLVGGRGVDLDGRHGVLLVLGSGRLGTFRVVVVDPGCGPGGGTLLADTLVGR